MKVAIVIPARIGSTRLPGKMLLSATGRPLIQHTCEMAMTSELADQVIVATDDPAIVRAVQSFGGDVRMTRTDHPSGTDRVAEVAETLGDVELVVNLQGDEPELGGAAIDLAIRSLAEDEQAVMSTLATPISDRDVAENPSVVKVVTDAEGRALYFSRSLIPFPRDESAASNAAFQKTWLQHVGLYVYRREFLLRLAEIPPCHLERTEKLEQLRVLFAGFRIKVAICDHPVAGIDLPEDYEAFVQRFLGRDAESSA